LVLKAHKDHLVLRAFKVLHQLVQLELLAHKAHKALRVF
jgi:hypothetical protein